LLYLSKIRYASKKLKSGKSETFSLNSSALLSLLIVSTTIPAYELSSEYNNFLPDACLDPPVVTSSLVFWPLSESPARDLFNSLRASSSLFSEV